jgi:hypothetical protein
MQQRVMNEAALYRFLDSISVLLAKHQWNFHLDSNPGCMVGSPTCCIASLRRIMLEPRA